MLSEARKVYLINNQLSWLTKPFQTLSQHALFYVILLCWVFSHFDLSVTIRSEVLPCWDKPMIQLIHFSLFARPDVSGEC